MKFVTSEVIHCSRKIIFAAAVAAVGVITDAIASLLLPMLPRLVKDAASCCHLLQHCVTALCRSTVPQHCVAALCRSIVSEHCAAIEERIHHWIQSQQLGIV